MPAVENAEPNQFIGRWKLLNDEGVTCAYLTVTATSAKQDHAAEFGKWEVVGKEARVSWSESGNRTIMRLEADGKIAFIGLGKVAEWTSPPKLRLTAVRMAR